MRCLLFLVVLMSSFTSVADPANTLRVATFNVSMEATNYLSRGQAPTGNELFELLAKGEHQQIHNIAEIIQRIRPDILLLNEFDYTPEQKKGIDAFQQNFLGKAHNGVKPIHYPYVYVAPVNTGVDSGHDLTGDGVASGAGGDAFGFGMYPGHFAMVLLSRYPIDMANVRTFQHFLWQDMPGNLQQTVKHQDGRDWFSSDAKAVMPLSSKSHWDIPIKIEGQVLHVLASHPTPPVFDGSENRNGKRNHDEIRFWHDYISAEKGQYIYDDKGHKGGFSGQRFVLLGDQNASPVEGNTYQWAIRQILEHPKVNNEFEPQSLGGKENKVDNPFAASHTAGWGMRADYVVPSKAGLAVNGGGVFWPKAKSPLYRLIESREASSDHRLVWLDLRLTAVK